MITLRDGLSLILYSIIADINDLRTDEELIEEIVESIVNEKISSVDILEEDIIVGYSEFKNFKTKGFEIELRGTWVYVEEHESKWQLKKCSSIEEAINFACNYICDVRIIHQGQLIDWDIIDKNKAFYVTNTNIQITNLN